ncbi:MAG: hypothetical protein IKH88_09150 [Prevotella sp.]|nr:hypothetical protein [Prevotella sp.]
MIHIPSSEITQPRLHADTLGFTFVWEGHFLRGIYPTAVEQAKGYFESGFIDEVVGKGWFPKTWISDFENEQFGMIIEHEMISPVVYAMEWNFNMLKDAALMVLEIAQTGWRHGYNMVDCHKLNVMFKNNRPMYVDLGSFIPRKEGETGYRPYRSFLRSYYYILDIWKDGASQIAKRMMANGLELNTADYYKYKSIVYRKWDGLLDKKIRWADDWTLFLAADKEKIIDKMKSERRWKRKIGIMLKMLSGKVRMFPSQNLKRVKKKISRFNLHTDNAPAKALNEELKRLPNLLNKVCPDARSATFIDSRSPLSYFDVLQNTKIEKVVAICQNESRSNKEYQVCKQKPEFNICCTQFQMLNNSILVAGKHPLKRLASDVVIIPDYTFGKSQFRVHNAIYFFNICKDYTRQSLILLHIINSNSEFGENLKEHGWRDLGNNWFVSQ